MPNERESHYGAEELYVQAELRRGRATIDIIEDCQTRFGLSSKEAEALVDGVEASLDEA